MEKDIRPTRFSKVVGVTHSDKDYPILWLTKIKLVGPLS